MLFPLQTQFTKFQALDLPNGLLSSAPGSSPNEICAPTPPEIQFFRKKNKLGVRENPAQAAAYEQALKNRPDIFQVQLWNAKASASDTVDTDRLRVGVNVSALGFQSIMQLPKHLERAQLNVQWRVVEHNGGLVDGKITEHPKLELTSCRKEVPAEQPPHFSKYPLRPEQLRSLAWMKAQESTSTPFYECGDEEYVLESLGWRAEVEAKIPTMVRGGILGDQVGYGKTAITLAMIDSSPVSEEDLPSIEEHDLIPTKTTLIVVPSHLPNQWEKEVKKFTGKNMTVAVVKNLTHLNAMTIKEIQRLDVLIVSETVLRTSDEYWYRLACFSGAGRLPPCTRDSMWGEVDRRFGLRYECILDGLRKRVRELTSGTEEGLVKMMSEMKEAVTRLNEDDVYVQPEVLHGRDLKDTARLEGEWMKSLDKKARESEEKKKKMAVVEEDREKKRSETNEKKLKKVIASISKDPWKLKSKEVKPDWRNMKSPPLEMFHWNRVVVDEFTYLSLRSRAAVHMGLVSKYRWALSGT